MPLTAVAPADICVNGDCEESPWSLDVFRTSINVQPSNGKSFQRQSSSSALSGNSDNALALVGHSALTVPPTVQLWSPKTGTFSSETLWQEKPVVIMLIRRPGCVLCRYQARELWLGLKNPLERLGVQLVALVHEWMDQEVKAFRPYWPGPVYQDKGQQLFQLLGGSQPLSAKPLLNPFSKVWKRIFEAKKHVPDFNFVGNGLVKGGVMVVRKGGSLTYLHVEKELGLPAPHDRVLEAAILATRSGSRSGSMTQLSSGGQQQPLAKKDSLGGSGSPLGYSTSPTVEAFTRATVSLLSADRPTPPPGGRSASSGSVDS